MINYQMNEEILKKDFKILKTQFDSEKALTHLFSGACLATGAIMLAGKPVPEQEGMEWTLALTGSTMAAVGGFLPFFYKAYEDSNGKADLRKKRIAELKIEREKLKNIKQAYYEIEHNKSYGIKR